MYELIWCLITMRTHAVNQRVFLNMIMNNRMIFYMVLKHPYSAGSSAQLRGGARYARGTALRQLGEKAQPEFYHELFILSLYSSACASPYIHIYDF